MTKEDIDNKLDEVLSSGKLDIDKYKRYTLKNRSSIGLKLEALWKAGELKFK